MLTAQIEINSNELIESLSQSTVFSPQTVRLCAVKGIGGEESLTLMCSGVISKKLGIDKIKCRLPGEIKTFAIKCPFPELMSVVTRDKHSSLRLKIENLTSFNSLPMDVVLVVSSNNVVLGQINCSLEFVIVVGQPFYCTPSFREHINADIKYRQENFSTKKFLEAFQKNHQEMIDNTQKKAMEGKIIVDAEHFSRSLISLAEFTVSDNVFLHASKSNPSLIMTVFDSNSLPTEKSLGYIRFSGDIEEFTVEVFLKMLIDLVLSAKDYSSIEMTIKGFDKISGGKSFELGAVQVDRR